MKTSRDKRLYPEPKKASLSVVIPAYNAEQWIGPTLEYLWNSIKKTNWGSIEVIVIDDGSKDKTAEAAKNAKVGFKNLKVVTQKNQGRLSTRRNGLALAKGDYMFLLDSRVYTDVNAFTYLVDQMNKNPNAVVWNGHIIVERAGNPYARFWYAITFIAWRRYMAKPRLTHYGTDDFDYYPKGAGCFFAPRKAFEKAYQSFTTVYEEDKYANDDTSLIRLIAEQHDIYIAPGFAFTYNSRSTLKAFLKHTLHRGIVLIDGYLHKGTRYFWPLIIFLLGLPVGVALAVVYPILFAALPLLMLFVFAIAKLLRAETADALALAYIGPVFGLYYTIGLYKGVFLRARTAWRRKRS